MTNFDDIITKAGNGSEYTLSDTERARMSHTVREYMGMKPLPTGRQASTTSYHYWLTFAHRPLAAALVLVLVFGSSISYAAESALPGDTLYTVKTYLNEPAKVALATNAEAKAEVQIELAERRIEEAATLASEGRLDEKTANRLAVAFESHAAALAENVAAADQEDDSASTEITSRFESRLAAHSDVLLEIESEDAEPHAARLAEAIRTATEETIVQSIENTLAIATTLEAAVPEPFTATAAPVDAPQLPEEASATIAMSTMRDTAISEETESIPDASSVRIKEVRMAPVVAETAPRIDAKKLSRMQSAAEKSLKSARKKLEGAKSLTQESRTSMEVDLALAATRIADGKSFLEADADNDAYQAFKESLRISEQTTVFIKAAPVLEKARSRAKNRTETDAQINANDTASRRATDVQVGTTSETPHEPRNDDTSPESENEKDDTTPDDHGSNPGADASSSSGSSEGEFNVKLDLSL